MMEIQRTASARRERTKHRSLTGRWVVEGELTLDSPAHFGNGDADALTDLPLFVDEVDGRALITGASVAGALRNYLREFERGYEQALPPTYAHTEDQMYQVWEEQCLYASSLFGGPRGDPYGAQSPLIVDDAPSIDEGLTKVELRDGVAIHPATRTAIDKKKYDYQILPAGTRFKLRFELLLDDDAAENEKRTRALALALRGLESGEIRLGARKRRGLGQCRVSEWTAIHHDLTDPDELVEWLATDHPAWPLERRRQPRTGARIVELLGVDMANAPEDQRQSFEICAEFEIEGSALVRSGFGDQDQGPDVVHLRTRNRQREDQPVLPGTSIGGALRQRALRIAKTLAGAQRPDSATCFVEQMFGPAEIKSGDRAYASRVSVAESFITGGHTLVQTRIKIDRFTGATFESALLEEAPHFGGGVTLRITLRDTPRKTVNAEIGLLLLLLKDLWLADLPLGGESSVGRGRLRGRRATLTLPDRRQVELTADENGTVRLSDPAMEVTLNDYVRTLNQHSWQEVK